MKKRFTCQEGVEWEAEAVPIQQELEPGQRIALMDQVPWRIHFTSDTAPYRVSADVTSDIGMGLMDLPSEELAAILKAAL